MPEEEPMDSPGFQAQFSEVVKMTQQQKQQEFIDQKNTLLQNISLIKVEDSELIEVMNSVVESLLWLKNEHDKEGSTSISYTKKKNKRGESEAHIVVSATYSRSIDVMDRETLLRKFLDKKIMLSEEEKDFVEE